MKDDEQLREILRLLRQRWVERPNLSFGEVVSQMACNGAGHTDVALVTDEQMLLGLRHGWDTR